jgi:hypothetical protein
VPARRLPAAEAEFVHPYSSQESSVAWCQGERGAVLRAGAGLVSQDDTVVHAEGSVALGPGGGERQRPLGRAADRFGPSRGGRAIGVKGCPRLGEPRPGLDKGRIERHGLLVRGNGLAVARWVVPLQGGLAPQEGLVGGQVLRGFRRQLVFGAVSERHVQRLRHLARDVGLHLEHVGHRGGVELLPPAGLWGMPGVHVHQLRGHPDPGRASCDLFPLDGRRE